MTCNMFYILLEEKKYISKGGLPLYFLVLMVSHQYHFLNGTGILSLRFLEVEYPLVCHSTVDSPLVCQLNCSIPADIWTMWKS